jgi:2OG-Fe(II) oxygenase superfamily
VGEGYSGSDGSGEGGRGAGSLSSTDLLDIERLERSLPDLEASYQSGSPFPHIVLDDVLLPDALERAYDEFEAIDDETWRKYLHVNERKYANTDPTTWGPVIEQIAQAFASERFVAFLERLTGLDDLLPDLSLDGGGLHRCLPGGYLNVHADFTAHHVHQTWHRRVNLLLYLNREWNQEWGGSLELWATDMSHCAQRVAPIGNRLLVFTTAEDSYHGHPEPLMCPPGVARQSLALYYFTEEKDPPVRSTNYRPRPGDGLKSAAIFLDKQVLHAYDVVKRRLRLSDESASRWLGALDRIRPSRGRARSERPGPS